MTATVYNTLPYVIAAGEAFQEREPIFAEVGELFAKYDFKWGLCLVHRHCQLYDDEIMIADGYITQPISKSQAGEYYPENWLSSGEPYEFTTRKTETPPEELFTALREILPKHLISILGVCHVDQQEDPVDLLEHTEGRKNILVPQNTTGELKGKRNVVETTWKFEQGEVKVMAACRAYCNVDCGGHDPNTHA
ncbi:hypothetical protein TWF281_005132 [Arthrobotrys megalospora]